MLLKIIEDDSDSEKPALLARLAVGGFIQSFSSQAFNYPSLKIHNLPNCKIKYDYF